MEKTIVENHYKIRAEEINTDKKCGIRIFTKYMLDEDGECISNYIFSDGLCPNKTSLKEIVRRINNNKDGLISTI